MRISDVCNTETPNIWKHKLLLTSVVKSGIAKVLHHPRMVFRELVAMAGNLENLRKLASLGRKQILPEAA